MVAFQILARQDFSPWSKYAEDNEVWGAQALAAMADRPALYSDKYDSDSGVVSRLRAISLASSVPDQYAAKVRRQLSISAKLSSSAPYQQGALQQKDDRGNVMALQTGTEAASSATGLFRFRVLSRSQYFSVFLCRGPITKRLERLWNKDEIKRLPVNTKQTHQKKQTFLKKSFSVLRLGRVLFMLLMK